MNPQFVLTLGRVSPQGVALLGTGFTVSKTGLIATTRHVVGDNDSGLVALVPNIVSMNEYQNISDNQCRYFPVRIKELDPINDLAILQSDISIPQFDKNITGFDDEAVGSEVGILGYPHCTHGRRAQTFQKAEIGAKVLLVSNGVSSKHAVINTQSRPGQSGSVVYSLRTGNILGILIGAWIPQGGFAMVGGINPQELHQTTHCASSEYIKDML